MTFEEYAEASLALQAAQLAEQREVKRLLMRLCAALAVDTGVQRVRARRGQALAAAGAFGRAQAGRKHRNQLRSA